MQHLRRHFGLPLLLVVALCHCCIESLHAIAFLTPDGLRRLFKPFRFHTMRLRGQKTLLRDAQPMLAHLCKHCVRIGRAPVSRGDLQR